MKFVSLPFLKAKDCKVQECDETFIIEHTLLKLASFYDKTAIARNFSHTVRDISKMNISFFISVTHLMLVCLGFHSKQCQRLEQKVGANLK